MNLPDFKNVSGQDIERIVENNEKQRFYQTVDEKTNKKKIRANQGHSLNVISLELKEITQDENLASVIHGTYKKYWKFIEKEGLSKGLRNHIHFAEKDPIGDQVISGKYLNMHLAFGESKICKNMQYVVDFII